jgi:hypothetical protein
VTVARCAAPSTPEAVNNEGNHMSTECKYPDIEVRLSGTDGNAFAILGTVQRALRNGGVDQAEVERFYAEATAGDYDNLLRVCMSWVQVV